MAAQQDFFVTKDLDKNVQQTNYLQFKNSVKDKLTWTKEEWNAKGIANSSINKLVNLINYNGRHLAEIFNNKTLLITLYNETQEAHISLQAILNTMKSLLPNKGFLGYYRPRNRKIIGLDFDSPETKEYVKNKLQYIGQDLVADLEWVNSASTIDVRLHWLHNSVSDAKIHIYLAKYMTITAIERETEPYTYNSNIHTSLISLKAKLHPGVSMDDVPHLTYFGGLQTLITIRGRVSLCLTCETLGHVAAKCPRPYCRVCKMNKPKRHTCVSQDTKASYARAVSSVHYSNKEQNVEDSCSEDEADEEDMDLQVGYNENKEEEEVNANQKAIDFPVLKNTSTKPISSPVAPPPLSPPPPLERGEGSAGTSNKTVENILKSQKVRRKKTKLEQNMSDNKDEESLEEDTGQENLLKKVKIESKENTTGIMSTANKNRSYGKNESNTRNVISNNLFDALENEDEGNPLNLFT